MPGLTDFISVIGTIVAGFFLLALAVETILESFRGALALVGIEALKSKMTMDAALEEAAEFMPPDSREFARFAGLASMVKKSGPLAEEVEKRCEDIIAAMAGALSPADKNAMIAREKLWLADLAGPIRERLQRNEDKRVFVLRIISAAIGVAIACAADLNMLSITGGVSHTDNGWYQVFGYVLAGLAAAGGSSFWHDQLDRIRSVKQIGQQLATIVPSGPTVAGGKP